MIIDILRSPKRVIHKTPPRFARGSLRPQTPSCQTPTHSPCVPLALPEGGKTPAQAGHAPPALRGRLVRGRQGTRQAVSPAAPSVFVGYRDDRPPSLRSGRAVAVTQGYRPGCAASARARRFRPGRQRLRALRFRHTQRPAPAPPLKIAGAHAARTPL